MALTSAEKEILKTFTGLNLNKIQIETIIRRPLTDREWRSYNRDYKSIFSSIAKQASNIAAKKFRIKKAKPSADEVEILRLEKQQKKIKPYLEDHKKIFKQIAFEAAKKVLLNEINISNNQQKSELRKQLVDLKKQEHLNEMKFKTYRIERIFEYTSQKFNAARSDWKIYNDVTMTNLDLAIRDLINKMTQNEPENVLIQLSIRFPHSDKQPHTKLLSKQDAMDQIYEWISFIVEYREVQISEATITLLKIHIPTGSGSSKNTKIVNKSETRSIVQIKNDDTLCCVKSIIVCLAYNHLTTLQQIFQNQLTEDEIKQINYKRRQVN